MRILYFASLSLVFSMALSMSCANEDSDPSICGGVQVSYQMDIKPILETNCIKSGCHNGDNGAERNWSIFSNVQAKALGIKALTGSRTMPADNPDALTQQQINLIACWVEAGAQNN